MPVNWLRIMKPMAARTTGFRRPFEPMRSRNEGLRSALRDARIAASWPFTSISASSIFANTPAASSMRPCATR